MVGWQRHIQCIIRHVGKRVEHTYSQSTNLSSSYFKSSFTAGLCLYQFTHWILQNHIYEWKCSYHMFSQTFLAREPYLQRLLNPLSSAISTPYYYQYLQQLVMLTILFCVFSYGCFINQKQVSCQIFCTGIEFSKFSSRKQWAI